MSVGAAYFRVSNEDLTIENQRAEVFRMAAARGYEIGEAHVYSDEVSGAAAKRDRPGIEALMQAAARGKFAAVFVWALDRFSRDDTFTGGLLMVGELDRYRVALLSYSETWLDTAGPFREPLVALSLKLAAQERAKLIGRTKEGLATRKRWIREKGGFWRDVKNARGEVERKWVEALGRPRVVIPERALLKAIELRTPVNAASTVMSWRAIASELKRLGFGDWTHGNLAAQCQKRVADLPRGKPGFPGPRGRAAVTSRKGRF